MTALDIRPDLILVGEPTSATRLGDTIKIGRRGSVNMRVRVPGTQGHVDVETSLLRDVADSRVSLTQWRSGDLTGPSRQRREA